MRKKRSATMFGRSDDPGRSHEALQAERESVDRFGTARSVLARMNPGADVGPDGDDGPSIRLLGTSAPEGYRRRRSRSSRTARSAGSSPGRSRPTSGRARSSSGRSRPRSTSPRARTATAARRAPSHAVHPPTDLVVTISRPTSRGRLQLDEEALARAGTMLREAREACELEIEDVSQACGLSPQQIEHFEAGRPPALAPVYVIGQLRTLARLYGLDERVVVPPPRPTEAAGGAGGRSRRSRRHGGGGTRANAHTPLVRRVAVDDLVLACQWLGCRLLQGVHAHQAHGGVAEPVVVPVTERPA